MSFESPPNPFDKPYAFAEVLHFSPPLRTLVKKCLSEDPDDRPSALDILSTCIDRACWMESYVSRSPRRE